MFLKNDKDRKKLLVLGKTTYTPPSPDRTPVTNQPPRGSRDSDTRRSPTHAPLLSQTSRKGGAWEPERFTAGGQGLGSADPAADPSEALSGP